MRPHWPIINQALRGALAEVTLAQLRMPPASVRTPPALRPIVIEETLA